jgi:azurin
MKLLYITAFLLVSRVASADVCKLAISATDQMRFEQQTLQVEAQCTEIEVTLHNSGKLPANIMGHDWVLTKTSDMASVANAGMGAGLANNYQKPGDKRIVAATAIIGGGESTTVRFSRTAGTRHELHILLFSARPLQHHEGPLRIQRARLDRRGQERAEITTARPPGMWADPG